MSECTQEVLRSDWTGAMFTATVVINMIMFIFWFGGYLALSTKP